MSELLLEIGTEEIPSGFIPKAMEEMQSLLEKAFQTQRIEYKYVKAMGTPRRLVLVATGVASAQEGRIVESVGPPKRIAFDPQGNPTKAALGFARGQGIPVEELKTIRTEKGEYVCAREEEKGEETFQLLPAILPRLISSIPFPKSMRWMDLENSFARPIHWVLALFDGKVIPFQIGNIPSGNISRGHRFMALGSFQVKDLPDNGGILQFRLRPWQAHIPGQFPTELRNRQPVGQVGRNRRENIAPMKSAAHLWQEVRWLVQRMHSDHLFEGQSPGQNSVVGSHEIVVPSADRDGSSIAADPGVDNDDVDGAFGQGLRAPPTSELPPKP